MPELKEETSGFAAEKKASQPYYKQLVQKAKNPPEIKSQKIWEIDLIILLQQFDSSFENKVHPFTRNGNAESWMEKNSFNQTKVNTFPVCLKANETTVLYSESWSSSATQL